MVIIFLIFPKVPDANGNFLKCRLAMPFFMYAVFRTKKFDKEFAKILSIEEQREVIDIEKRQIANNPYVGNPLCYSFFREKRVGGKRIYFLVYSEMNAVLMVAISNKKAQQETIDEIRIMLKGYYFVVKAAVMQHGVSGHV